MSEGEEVSADLLEPTEQIGHARDIEQPMETENYPPRIEEFRIPDGEQYSLISKRLKPSRIQQIAEALGLPTVSSTAEARQMIQEKLSELDYEPLDVQVIVQGRGDDASIF